VSFLASFQKRLRKKEKREWVRVGETLLLSHGRGGEGGYHLGGSQDPEVVISSFIIKRDC